MNSLKVLIAVCAALLLPVFSGICEAGSYDYPIADPYAATILGTPSDGTQANPPKAKVRNLSLTVLENRQIPEVFWYHDKLRYSLAAQTNTAPMIFVIAGTGAGYNSMKMKMLQQVLYGAGFHVVNLSSPTHPNFMVTASTHSLPGDTHQDAVDLYRVMTRVWQQIQNRIRVSDFYLTGYSLGGAQAAFVSKLDEVKQVFNFKKVLMINPPVNLFTSVVILDNMLEDNIPGGIAHFNAYFETVMNRFSEFYSGYDFLDFNDQFFFDMYRERDPKQSDMAAAIGLSFRISSTNMFFTADVLSRSGYIVPKNLILSPNDSLTDYFKVFMRQTFVDYLDELLFPYYSVLTPGLTREQFIADTSLTAIKSYLKSAGKIGLVTNADDLILGPGDLAFIRSVFQDRARIFPTGGHCGNMSYKDNIAHMIDFFNN